MPRGGGAAIRVGIGTTADAGDARQPRACEPSSRRAQHHHAVLAAIAARPRVGAHREVRWAPWLPWAPEQAALGPKDAPEDAPEDAERLVCLGALRER